MWFLADEAPNRRILKRLLLSLGVVPPTSIIKVLKNGLDALSYLTDSQNYSTQAASGTVLVLMDIIMPGMTGVEVMRALPAQTRSMFTAVAVTGNVDAASLATYKEVGFASVLPKPFGRSDLARVLSVTGTGRPPAV